MLGCRRRWAEVGVLVAALVICHIAVPVLKEAIDRPRPEGGLVGRERRQLSRAATPPTR